MSKPISSLSGPWAVQFLPPGRHDGWLAVDDIRPTDDPTNIPDDADMAATDLGAAVRIMWGRHQVGPIIWPPVPADYPVIVVGADYVELGAHHRREPRWLRVTAYTPYCNSVRVATVINPDAPRTDQWSHDTGRSRDLVATQLHTTPVTKFGKVRRKGYLRADIWDGART